ncbi:proline dehydrogenase family protein [Bacillus sp. Marseille-P3661]|uniref:proline dehydrogenase family protein n=1 Tax=Bacillus sp. Marseille-P3661 TaxID=1936234 RepID=UPI000C81B4CA|nr:proline dehydrogenase family protein [Bacillus sp. Marseille-P3661]
MERILRRIFLGLSKSKFFIKVAKKYGLRFGGHRFVAGETIYEAVEVTKQLNKSGKDVTIDYLGEFVDRVEEATERTNECIKAIEQISKEVSGAQLSVKLTSMGLDISDEVVLANMFRILQCATKHGVFVTIDMEDYSRYERTINIYKLLRTQYDNLGTVLQAYLYRAESDLSALSELYPHLRLVKGAYKESEEVAFPKKADVDENFKKLIKTHLLNGSYTAIATHDEKILNYTKEIVDEYEIPYDQFEFQMLYGVCPELQEKLVLEGYKMRVYVPYGRDWFGYFMRRLAERPANVAFVLRGLFK